MNPVVYAQRIDRAHPAMIFCTPREPAAATEVAMGRERWQPQARVTEAEKRLMKVAGRSRKLFVFLREHRDELFDAAFQDELERMYRQTGQGEEPRPPALMCMALLVQGYMQVSDAEAVRLSASDRCWRMVLGTIWDDEDEPAFSQGGLQQFRERLIQHDMDLRLLERTVELARRTKAFDWKKLPKTLRVAVDSSPLAGAGRVEDTTNLLAHAARKVVQCAADLLGWTSERVAREAGIPLLLETSVKRALDIEWSDPLAKAGALDTLVEQLDSLDAWLRKRLPEELAEPPLKEHFDTLVQIRTQDLEPDPDGGG